MDLPTLKLLLEIATTDTSQDVLLTRIIASGYSIVESYIHYPLTVETKTMIFRGDNSVYAISEVYPITTITSISEDTNNVVTDITADVSIRNSFLGVLYRGNGFNDGSTYTLIYTVGYVTVPPGLEQALQQIILTLYSQMNRVKDGVKSIKTPDGTITYDNKILTTGVTSILDLFSHDF